MLEADFESLPEKIRDYVPQCPGCTPDALLSEQARPCSHYDCPGLPSELEVTCGSCMYDFAAGDGKVDCDHEICPEARRLESNVRNYRIWLKHLRFPRR